MDMVEELRKEKQNRSTSKASKAQQQELERIKNSVIQEKYSDLQLQIQPSQELQRQLATLKA